MELQNRILTIAKLGSFFSAVLNRETETEEFQSKLKMAQLQNQWFTTDNLEFCLKRWSELLTKENIESWLSRYNTAKVQKNVGIIMAGNLPLVGLHDLISVILSGHTAVVKTSSKDDVLMSAVIDFLTEENDLKTSVFKTVKLGKQDAVIATGSNNTARYFEFYFGKIPHIIRKNRTGVAVLNGDETDDDLKLLAEDIFRYFGLGCRSVTHLFLPNGYDTNLIFKNLYEWKEIIHHSKYANNYEYNRAVYLLSKENFLDNNFLILKESKDLHSPIGVLNYSHYNDLNLLKKECLNRQDEIQCIVGNELNDFDNSVGFGQSQKPGLTDYADGVDVMKFLGTL